MHGRTDHKSLALCVSALLNYDADTNITVEGCPWQLLHYLAASWQHEALDFLLENGANVLAYSAENGMNALHMAADASPLKAGRGEGYRIVNEIEEEEEEVEELNREDGVPTLRALLKAGARPNVRDGQGRTALQLVVEAEAVWGHRVGFALELLLGCGARVLDESTVPWTTFLKISPVVSVDRAVQEWSSVPVLDTGELGITFTPLGDFQEGENKPVGAMEASR